MSAQRPAQDAEQLRAEIDQTRDDLVATTQALSDKLTQRRQETVRVAVPVAAAAATFLLVFLGLNAWDGRR